MLFADLLTNGAATNDGNLVPVDLIALHLVASYVVTDIIFLHARTNDKKRDHRNHTCKAT